MKTLFIGIGGNGVKTLGAIKKKMDSYVKFAEAQGRQVNINDEFLFLDTATNDVLEIPGVDLNNDFVSLNTTPATQFYHEKNNYSRDASRFFEWYDPQKTGLSSFPLSDGAGAIRMDGRLGLYANRDDFKVKVRDKMTTLNGVAANDSLRALPMSVYVFSGTSGGTGSGILLDVLMTIDKTFTQIVANANTSSSVTLFLFGPDQTFTIESDPDIQIKKAKNGAAFLYELDAFKKCTIKNSQGSHRIFNRLSGWVDGLELTTPFHFPKYVYYLDNTLAATGLANAQTVSYKVMHDLAADFVFNMEVGKLNKFNELAGANNVVGIRQLDSLLVNGNQNDIDVNGFCKMFSSFAPLSVCFPKELFSLYCSTRFSKECFYALNGKAVVGDLNSKKTAFKTVLDTKLNELRTNIKGIFENAEKSRKTVAGGISVNETEHRIMYDESKAPVFYKNMAPVVIEAKSHIKDMIYRHFAEMLQTEGVGGVIETVMACDGMLTSKTTELKKQVVAIPQPGFWQTDSSYFKEVLECIYKLIEIEIYDYCSLGNDGVLDHVTSNLQKLQVALSAKRLKCEKDQGDLIGTLNAEDNNPLRQYVPSLDTIVKNNDFVKGNEFERVYDNAFTPGYINTVRQMIFDDENIKQAIFDIVRFGEVNKASGVVVAMAKMVDNMFQGKFNNDEEIGKYVNSEILDKLTQKYNNGDHKYQDLLKGHVGALFPTNDAVLNAHGHMMMVLANFKGNATIKAQYLPTLNDKSIDDAFFADRVVSFYITNGLTINDISSLNETYLPKLKNEMPTHPAFSNKLFDIVPFTKDTIYEAMTGGSVELSKDLLALLMLCLLDVKAGRTDLYTVGDRVNGKVTLGSKTCEYYYQILDDRSIVLAFPTFFKDPVKGIKMDDYTDSTGKTLEARGVGKNYSQQQSILQETKDCYNHILKGTISESEIVDALERLRSMLKIRLNDNDVEYLNFASLFANPRYQHDFETMVIEDNINLLGI